MTLGSEVDAKESLRKDIPEINGKNDALEQSLFAFSKFTGAGGGEKRFSFVRLTEYIIDMDKSKEHS